MIGKQERWQEDLFVAGPLSSLIPSHTHRMKPFYKQHGAVDDRCGVIVDADITTGQDNRGLTIAGRAGRQPYDRLSITSD